MKIEKLTENKIRITLNLSDLEEEHIDLHSFMSNSAESQALFCSLLNKAEKEVGFYTKDYKLMIEAIAVPEGNFILTVTRLPEKEQVKKQLKIKREIAKVIILNNKNIVLRIVNISLGGSNFACIEPKDVLAEAIKMQAPKIILIHNHPSGDPKPSKSDYKVTDRIYECADLMGIELLDHVVIGDGIYESVLMGKET